MNQEVWDKVVAQSKEIIRLKDENYELREQLAEAQVGEKSLMASIERQNNVFWELDGQLREAKKASAMYLDNHKKSLAKNTALVDELNITKKSLKIMSAGFTASQIGRDKYRKLFNIEQRERHALVERLRKIKTAWVPTDSVLLSKYISTIHGIADEALNREEK